MLRDCFALLAILTPLVGAQVKDTSLAERYQCRGVFAGAAALEDTATGSQRSVRVGDDVDGWTVESIRSEGVRLTREGRRTFIRIVSQTTPEEDAARTTERTGNRGPGAPRVPVDQEVEPTATLQVIAGQIAFFKLQPGGRTVRLGVGELLGGRWRIDEMEVRSLNLVSLEGDETRVLATGETIPIDARSSAGEAEEVEDDAPLRYLGDVSGKAIFEVATASGLKQVSASPGEPLSLEFTLERFDKELAIVVTREGEKLELYRSRPRETPYDSVEQVPLGAYVAPYPYRIPLWERDVRNTLAERRLTLDIDRQDLDQTVSVLRDIYGLPLCLDPDVVEELPDTHFQATIKAVDLAAERVVEQLISGKPLVAEPAFGCLMIGLAHNVLPLIEKRRLRDDVLREMDALRQAASQLVDPRSERLEAQQMEQLRFQRVEVEERPNSLADLIRLIAGEIPAPYRLPEGVAREGAEEPLSPETAPVGIELGRQTLQELLEDGIAEYGLDYRWSGNLLWVLEEEAATAFDERRERLRVEQAALVEELLGFDEELDLGLDRGFSGRLWQLAMRLDARGTLQLILDEPTWFGDATEIELEHDATLGSLVEAISRNYRLLCVQGSDGRVFVLQR